MEVAVDTEVSTDFRVSFGDPPPPSNRSNTQIYDEITEQLKARPGHWAKCAEIVGKKALYRWTAAMKKRGVYFAQRKVRDDTWAVWCMYPEQGNG